VTLRSSPLLSTFQSYTTVSSCTTPAKLQTRTRTLLSPPAVASRPLPWGSKWAEYMGAFSLCQDTSSGAAFIVGVDTAQGRSMWVLWERAQLYCGVCSSGTGREGCRRPQPRVRCLGCGA
jgi:hypothetical protein